MHKTFFLHFFPWWPPFLLWLVILAWLSLTPSPPRIDVTFLDWDKLQHAGAYGLMTFLAGRAFQSFSRSRRHWLWAFIFAIACGGLMEVGQGLMTDSRVSEIGDIFANITGAGLVFFLFRKHY